MMPNTEILTLSVLRKSFGARVLLDIENLTLHSSTAYVLTGMNGVGKTVFLRILAGLESADFCRLKYQQQEYLLSPYPAALRVDVVYVHQHPLMFQMSVAENIAYGLKLRNTPKLALKESVDAALEWAGLTEIRGRLPHGLSGGEKQKIALARAKILEPKILLLDEPSANLDGVAREMVIELIPTLLSKDMCIVMACHDRDLLNMSGMHHIKLRDGKIENRGLKIVDKTLALE